MQQQLQLLGIFLVHHIQFIVQYAADAVRRAVDRGDFLRVQRGADHAVGAGVDDGRGPAGLTEDAGANQFLAHCQVSSNIQNEKNCIICVMCFLIMQQFEDIIEKQICK